MTGNARLRNMCSRQWELGRAVVEGRGMPGGRVMASRAIVGEIVRHMIRISRSREC